MHSEEMVAAGPGKGAAAGEDLLNIERLRTESQR